MGGKVIDEELVGIATYLSVSRVLFPDGVLSAMVSFADDIPLEVYDESIDLTFIRTKNQFEFFVTHILIKLTKRYCYEKVV